MNFRRFAVFVITIFSSVFSMAQKAVVKGKVYSEQGEVLAGAIVILVGNDLVHSTTDSSGYYQLNIPDNRNSVLEARFFGYQPQQQTIHIEENGKTVVNFNLKPDKNQLGTVEIIGYKGNNNPKISTLKIDPKIPKYLPSAFGDFNKIIATIGLGVATNSELSSAYAVRGGNYDENLVYVNGMEIYRPFLVRSGQQEGLSFINPDLAGDIEFSAGGWQPKYGDKLSSVLAVKYREPKKFKASFTIGLLGGAIHVENRSPNKRFTYLIGLRQKSAQYLLNTLQTKGEYKPKFYDLQSLFTYDLTSGKRINSTPGKTSLSLLLTYARNRYLVVPTSRETSFGTNAQVLKLNVDFEGREIMNYDNYQGGLILAHRFSQKFKTDITISTLFSREVENYDIISRYRLCEVVTDPNSSQFNQCAFERGTGGLLDHARNELSASVITLKHSGIYSYNSRHVFEYGVQVSREIISDVMSEYSLIDSGGFADISRHINSSVRLSSYRPQAYIQHQYTSDSSHFLTYGIRFNYWTLNQQLLVSPRIQYAWVPHFNKDLTFKAGAGVYQQAPFFRELRNDNGYINESLKAQTSYHIIAGSDLNFEAWNRKFKFSTEAYYKYLENVIPYDIDNVRLRYFALNNARAYATGVDLRVSGEFIKDSESWFTLGVMQTKEDIEGDSLGYIRRPTDQRITASVFFQDHIPNNPSLKVYLNLVFASGLPFGPPDSEKYRSAFTAPPYRRVDIGFSKLLTYQDKEVVKSKYLESLWLSFEVLNLLGVPNTLSYLWIKDINDQQFAIPNTLSSRFYNLRLIAKF